MNRNFTFILIIAILSCAYGFMSRYHPYPYYPPAKRQIYGNIEDAERIGYQHERRYGIPFFTREALIIFPSVGWNFIFLFLFFIFFDSFSLIILIFIFTLFIGVHYRRTV